MNCRSLMGRMVPISQMVTVASYVLTQKLKGRKKYPLLLMIEPLFRCNLACAGCGKIQYPEHVLNRRLTPEQCWAAADECGTPMVAIAGVRNVFDTVMDLGVEGMMISPASLYDKAPDQDHCLHKQRSNELFKQILENPNPRWKFNLSPLFLRFLQGKIEYDCTPWGMPTYNIFGWQKPCYLLQDGYASTFDELMKSTAWASYGSKSGNSKCPDCMMHSGYAASAVDDTFISLARFARSVNATLFSS